MPAEKRNNFSKFIIEGAGCQMFESKKYKALQPVVNAIKNDVANNYKDNAVGTLKRLKMEVEAATLSNELKAKEIKELSELIAHYDEILRNFKRTY